MFTPPFRKLSSAAFLDMRGHHISPLLAMSLLFVIALLLVFSPAACKAFWAHGRQESAPSRVGNNRGRRSRTGDAAFVAPGAPGTAGTADVNGMARDAKPRCAKRRSMEENERWIPVLFPTVVSTPAHVHVRARTTHDVVYLSLSAMRAKQQIRRWHRSVPDALQSPTSGA